MEKTYKPSEYEDKIYKFWLKENLFHSEPDETKKPFTIVIPPPNVTDKLHIGHALNNTLQDILIRWKKLKGYNAEWLPGVDHAGIATQVKVEQMLYEKGIKREEIGREKFLEYVWDWKNKHGNEIIDQLKKLGSACDWDREHFTMDEDLSKAVRKAFVTLYKEGLIYRDNYMVNWCPRCHTAIADEEVEYKEEQGYLYYVKYPLKDSEEYLTVATTRPETMYGDTAVAVNPNDKRYAKYIGKSVILPLANREIPVIGDEYVDMEFGTGALKITPAHDPNDFQIGRKHNLETVIAIDSKGKMNDAAGDLKGFTREEAREKTVERLERDGYLAKKEAYTHSVGHCYRCKATIEPYISTQWFVKMKPLAKPAIKAVKSGRIKFTPEHWTKVYLHWMENIQDWCISRQLWWGHQIPVFYCKDCGEEIVEMQNPEKCPKCGSKNIEQDPDVLDTWFSSWLWPFSTFGWPEKTKDLEYYYPTDVLATASEIIFFWVARMIMAGEKFMGEIPFHDVYIHGTVRDKNGIKMSKSLGNGIDPRDIIGKYGADALRFSMIAVSGKGQDPHIGYNTFEIGRNFANKVWNIARFILLKDADSSKVDMSQLNDIDKWILSEFDALLVRYDKKMESFDFQEIAMDVYDFIWHKLADWYIEYVKIMNSQNGFNVALSVFENALILLHPFMPFVTEVIYKRINGEESSIMRANFPKTYNVKVKIDAGKVWEIIKTIRNLKSELDIEIKKNVDVTIVAQRIPGETIQNLMENTIRGFVNVNSLNITSDRGEIKRSICVPVDEYEVCLPISGNVNAEEQINKFNNEIEFLKKEIEKADRQLSNDSFVKKAPENVVNALRDKRLKYNEKLRKLQQYVDILKENF
ncbi:valine--tRNA ligase [candidate division TA06 bacterium]|uniref:Valine--tRNA ligase n=1 Tax=candidate division TA06 bacterium TaxID=2250710 RepID=A0A660SA09_UNCT6|nr:MAG: valine--tRNA ligase [candidate division TA06 bacterium]